MAPSNEYCTDAGYFVGRLPDEIWAYVFTFVHYKDLMNIFKVNRRWGDLLAISFVHNFGIATLPCNPTFTPEEYEYLLRRFGSYLIDLEIPICYLRSWPSARHILAIVKSCCTNVNFMKIGMETVLTEQFNDHCLELLPHRLTSLCVLYSIRHNSHPYDRSLESETDIIATVKCSCRRCMGDFKSSGKNLTNLTNLTLSQGYILCNIFSEEIDVAVDQLRSVYVGKYVLNVDEFEDWLPHLENIQKLTLVGNFRTFYLSRYCGDISFLAEGDYTGLTRLFRKLPKVKVCIFENSSHIVAGGERRRTFEKHRRTFLNLFSEMYPHIQFFFDPARVKMSDSPGTFSIFKTS